MMLRDIEFEGPFEMGIKAPESAGLYLVCTESSGGIRILGVYDADNIDQSLASTEFKEKWVECTDMGLFYYYSEMDIPSYRREEKVQDIISTRPYDVLCVKPIKDDW